MLSLITSWHEWDEIASFNLAFIYPKLHLYLNEIFLGKPSNLLSPKHKTYKFPICSNQILFATNLHLLMEPSFLKQITKFF